jgi:hypothetical protein
MSSAAIATRGRGAGTAAGPEAEAPQRPLGRVLSSREFWELMERWRIPDATALELIGFPGKLRASGRRPRFRFTTRQRRITSYLPEIDAALAAAGKDPAWLHRKIQTAPLLGRTPVEHMTAHGMDGMADLLRLLNRAAMRAALTTRCR